jgi:hypothetical protein
MKKQNLIKDYNLYYYCEYNVADLAEQYHSYYQIRDAKKINGSSMKKNGHNDKKNTASYIMKRKRIRRTSPWMTLV